LSAAAHKLPGNLDRKERRMGAKDWMLLYAERDVDAILTSRVALNREATRAIVARQRTCSLGSASDSGSA
jgi:hypothetical protein